MEWANAKDYAELAGMPVKTIRRMCRSGVLPHIQVGRVYKVNVGQADAVLTSMASEKRPAYTDFRSALNEMKRRLKNAGV